jgi:hypothetical protein
MRRVLGAIERSKPAKKGKLGNAEDFDQSLQMAKQQ